MGAVAARRATPPHNGLAAAVAADGASLVATGGQQCCAGGGPRRSQVGPAVTPHESRAECVSGLARSLEPVGCCEWRLASGKKLATKPDP